MSLLALTLAAQALIHQTPLTLVSEAERKAMVTKMSRTELENTLKTTPSQVLLSLSAQSVKALGSYSYVMVKQERINGTLQGEQTIRTTIREEPNAIRLEYLKGPAAGRKLIYNSEVKKDEFRVREAGLVSIFGRLWIPVKSDLTKGDSNHTVPEAGLGALVRRLQADGQRAGDRISVKHEGWTEGGHFCSLYILPDGGKGFDNASTRVCYDPLLGVPMKVEGFDAKGGLIERYSFSDVKAVSADENTFDPEKGL